MKFKISLRRINKFLCSLSPLNDIVRRRLFISKRAIHQLPFLSNSQKNCRVPHLHHSWAERRFVLCSQTKIFRSFLIHQTLKHCSHHFSSLIYRFFLVTQRLEKRKNYHHSLFECQKKKSARRYKSRMVGVTSLVFSCKLKRQFFLWSRIDEIDRNQGRVRRQSPKRRANRRWMKALPVALEFHIITTKKSSQSSDFCSIRNNQFFFTEPRQT